MTVDISCTVPVGHIIGSAAIISLFVAVAGSVKFVLKRSGRLWCQSAFRAVKPKRVEHSCVSVRKVAEHHVIGAFFVLEHVE